NVERSKHSVTDEEAADLFRFGQPGDVHGAGGPYAKRLEGAVLLAIGDKHRGREAQKITGDAGQPAKARRGMRHRHQFPRFRIWERFEEYAVDDAEDCSIGAYSNRERQQSDHGKRGTAT